MADLLSPGVSVTVTDESFYAATGVGTVPLIVVATKENKTSSDGVSLAKYTTPAEAGKVYAISSQRELLINYGNPEFYTSGGTPLNGYELNEYGLEAARSYLGFANRAFVLRADIDLAALEPAAEPPVAAPENGTFWVDISSRWGIKRRVGNQWVLQDVSVPAPSEITGDLPKNSYGLDFDIAAVYYREDGSTRSDIRLCERRSGQWFLIGSVDGFDPVTGNPVGGWRGNAGNQLVIGTHLNIPAPTGNRPDGSPFINNDLFLQMTAPNQGTEIVVKSYDSSLGQWITEPVYGALYDSEAYAFYSNQGGPEVGDLWADYNESPLAIIEIKRWDNTGTVGGEKSYTFVGQSVVNSTDLFLIDEHLNNAVPAMYISVGDSGLSGDFIPVRFTTPGTLGEFASLEDAVADINSSISSTALPASLYKSLTAEIVGDRIRFVQPDGLSVKFYNGAISGWDPSILGITQYGTSVGGTAPVVDSTTGYSGWELLSYVASNSAPSGEIADGTLWYDNVISLSNLDLLVNNGASWGEIANDVQIQVTAPTTDSTGNSLSDGDLWISTDNLENYPEVYRWAVNQWVRLNTADQETENGILFTDYRAEPGSSPYADAANPALYPTGMLLWNTSFSGGVVKQWSQENQRWQTVSGNRADGSPYMLRKAQRRMVVRAMQQAISGNDNLRNENLDFNLIAAPGYPELIDEMVSLNVDRKETAFILADTPMRLKSDVTSMTNWANNAANAAENGEDGLLTRYPYMAVYYPSARTTAIDGTNVVVPASHVTLRTLAFNDQVAYPWFAPAGYQRGLVSNATSVGYIDGESGEYQPVQLNEGQRDALYINNINPIAQFPSRGLVVFGQKTLNPTDSALDRVNVARLVVYIRTVLDDAVRPFLFEPNDSVTRSNAKTVVDRFLSQLITNRALNDFVTVCDTSNNTPDRIDRNELWIDIAIQPIKSVEFIYVPIRIQNTIGTAQ